MSYIRVFFVCSIYVCSCYTPSFSSPSFSSVANSCYTTWHFMMNDEWLFISRQTTWNSRWSRENIEIREGSSNSWILRIRDVGEKFTTLTIIMSDRSYVCCRSQEALDCVLDAVSGQCGEETANDLRALSSEVLAVLDCTKRKR